MIKIAKIVAATSAGLVMSIGSAFAVNNGHENDSVPEINASTGLEALALLVVAVLIVREVIVRRRQA